ncbi:30S ribosomal protein S18 [Patescibacteria group bacterium]|nr:30S ribosomal protein S18 [Patescibacteria group bacterium]MCG2701530.1 30S ribosomal protein S18 [Candidatus Parcubacteria bacterium]MBU4210462.1 30S ribosomal protein S18 [Patescibacteria group bacterium]MBU4265267.1 30S ribosomal protein S18 [Patescibacteria group bacterium]MBU4389952.1 30S ribosomal protein S18 [Patescibacteria group bacterium]
MRKVKKKIRKRARAKECPFCKDKSKISWEEYELLKDFLSPRARILSRSITAVCAKHQKHLTRAVKRARHLALLPFVVKSE